MSKESKGKKKSKTKQVSCSTIMSRHSLTESYASSGVEPVGSDKKKIIEKIINDLDSEISEEEISKEE